ncbi:hypothetical protein IV203_001980 [Nitzschia inconspicua]|uniref:Uncharacterized protein n=1 Tax=Nitzschia inconspicua TaxID=303405 RepID=A0A9K3L7Z1_9STRA|nr:hypothetical protein IV203_001980 [Nitzschia inconspicua]
MSEWTSRRGTRMPNNEKMHNVEELRRQEGCDGLSSELALWQESVLQAIYLQLYATFGSGPCEINLGILWMKTLTRPDNGLEYRSYVSISWFNDKLSEAKEACD